MSVLRNLSLRHIRLCVVPNSKSYCVQVEKQTITTEINGVRNIVLDNPKTRNSLSMDMMTQLVKDIKRNQNDENLRCIVLSASAGKIFSAGHNLKELRKETGVDFHKAVFAKASELMTEILKCPVPVIAKVDGLAAAAGCQLIASCDLVVCSDRSSFSTPGANFGIFCSTPGIQVVRNIPKKKAAYMLFTGLPLSAQDALTAGLVSSCVPVDQLDAETEKICEAIKNKSRVVVELGKKFYYEQISMDINVAYKYGEQVMVDNLALPDGQEGVRSFIEKRKPNWSHII